MAVSVSRGASRPTMKSATSGRVWLRMSSASGSSVEARASTSRPFVLAGSRGWSGKPGTVPVTLRVRARCAVPPAGRVAVSRSSPTHRARADTAHAATWPLGPMATVQAPVRAEHGPPVQWQRRAGSQRRRSGGASAVTSRSGLRTIPRFVRCRTRKAAHDAKARQACADIDPHRAGARLGQDRD